MHSSPSAQPQDVKIAVMSGNSVPGTDEHGIVTGRWKTGLFGFTESLVPNGFMSFCCPGISVAQISQRLGLLSYNQVIGIFGVVYLVALIAACTRSAFWDFLIIIAVIALVLSLARLRTTIRKRYGIPGGPAKDAAYSFCCGSCSIAQMASHVESYEPGSCKFGPPETLTYI
ncbi:hypothetical protein ABG067_007337 [Albugo candida]|uniref:Transmembrane protein n=1 Tax=Albugo candida TaxID=65357 RepID=A0A024GU21_9STRA|nr:unnamed protein product [Albugo candida]|eukprot:CCI49850.1 unnamed protein product [Albugo candida]